jgi:hypothetical protein
VLPVPLLLVEALLFTPRLSALVEATGAAAAAKPLASTPLLAGSTSTLALLLQQHADAVCSAAATAVQALLLLRSNATSFMGLSMAARSMIIIDLQIVEIELAS